MSGRCPLNGTFYLVKGPAVLLDGTFYPLTGLGVAVVSALDIRPERSTRWPQ
jgi:hypothetical protein